MTKLKINPEFKDLIPPLSEGEYNQLTQNILAQGCRDAIKTWNGTIIDGHNRHAICQANGIPYDVSTIWFPSKKDAVIWILENQLGRRNLPEAMRIKLALRKADMLREKSRQNRSKPGCNPIHIRKAAARDAGVSEGKVHMYMKVQQLGDAELLQQIEAGKLKISAAYNKAAGPGLAVATRKVEVFYDSGSAPDITNPICATAMRNQAERVEKLYYLIADEYAPVCGPEDMARVRGRLDAQAAMLQELARI